MRAKNPNFVSTPANIIAQIQAQMNNKDAETFDDLRQAIPDLALMPDNEIAQAVADAGFVVEFQLPTLEQ